MNMYVSVFLTMMLVVGLAATAGKLDSHSRDRKTYEDGVALCERSGCKPDCGTFGHNSMNRVEYNPSVCEQLFQREEKKALERKLDAEIRAKFKDGGQ